MEGRHFCEKCKHWWVCNGKCPDDDNTTIYCHKCNPDVLKSYPRAEVIPAPEHLVTQT